MSSPGRRGPQFASLARYAAGLAGRPAAFAAAALLVVLWLASGPLFGWSETWQLLINTSTTILTFLMIFLLQSTQNRDTEAVQLKLDELIRAMKGAHTALLDLEELSEEELSQIVLHYQDLAAKARAELRQGRTDVDSPEVEGLKEGEGAAPAKKRAPAPSR